MNHEGRFREREQQLFEPDSGLEIRWSADNGRSLVTTRARRRGEVLWREHPAAAVQSLGNRDEVEACRRCLRAVGTLESQMRLAVGEGVGPLLGSDEYPLCGGAEMSCQWGCGIRYCSLACADADMREGHSLLCTGPLQSEDHPLMLFKQYAIKHNEVFFLVGKWSPRFCWRWPPTRAAWSGPAPSTSSSGPGRSTCVSPGVNVSSMLINCRLRTKSSLI